MSCNHYLTFDPNRQQFGQNITVDQQGPDSSGLFSFIHWLIFAPDDCMVRNYQSPIWLSYSHVYTYHIK
jgi:hypothetical protein